MVYDKSTDAVNPIEEITLSYDMITWEYNQYNLDGTKKGTLKDSWNNVTKAKI